MEDERERLRRLIEEAQERLAAMEGGTGDVTARGDLEAGGDIVTGVQVNHIVHVYQSGKGSWSEADYRAALGRYLAWLRAAAGQVVLSGIKRGGQQVVQLPLDEVYVPLAAEALPEAREELKRPGRRPAGEPDDLGGTRRITMRDLLGQGSRLAVVGAPGCGKTTVLYHIAWTLAEALATGNAGLAADRLGLPGELPLPVYVPLSLYAEHRRRFTDHPDPRQRQLATFINHYLLERQAGLALPDDFFSTLLNRGQHVILLLDGLDEVPSEDERALVSQAVADLTYGRPHARFVVTCRTRAYQGKAVLSGDFRVVRVLPLEPDQVADLIRRAYRSIYPADEEQDRRDQRAADLVAGVEKLEAERAARLGGGEESRLVTTPLLVRMLLIVHFNLRRLPDQRAELYMEVVDTLLTSAYNPDEAVAQRLAQLGGDWRARRDMLQVLAFQMHSRGQKAGREIGEQEMTDWLCAYLTERRRKPAEAAEALAADLVAASRQRGGLLEERAGRYRFAHLTFQEFLAARYLAEVERDAERIAQFIEEEGRAAGAWWREPALLTVGYLSVTAPDTAADLVHGLAHLDEAQPPGTAPALAAAELAATAFLEWGGAESCRADLATRLTGLVTDANLRGAAPALRAAAGRALAYLGDPRPGVGVVAGAGSRPSVPDIAWCEVPTGPFRLGANPGEEAWKDELPQHELNLPTFYIARYPITNAQFAPFVAGGGYAERRWWTPAGWKWRTGGKREEPDLWRDEHFNQPNQPVVGVSWYEAAAYCAWLTERVANQQNGKSANQQVGKHLHLRRSAAQVQVSANQQVGKSTTPGFADLRLADLGLADFTVRLPSEAEWEKAAGWDPAAGCKRVYAWGDDWDGEKANAEMKVGRLSAVGVFPGGAADCGALDMSGNVWEWTASLYQEYPYRPDGGREDPSAEGARTLRGGSWSDLRRYARVSSRSYYDPDNYFFYSVGFRVVVAPV
jgi:formylglycine-generating enzyme required for sulfatase activity